MVMGKLTIAAVLAGVVLVTGIESRLGAQPPAPPQGFGGGPGPGGGPGRGPGGGRGRGGTPDPNVENGSRIYAETCYRCHGDGDQIAGVDLRRGQFRHASTDEDLQKLIRNGIPGTAMPANELSAYELASVVAYLRSNRAADSTPITLGDAAAGKALFEGKGGCLACHRVNGKGSRIALDLSDVGAGRSPAYLQRTLLDPNATLVPQNHMIRAVTRDGATITGRRLNEDTETVQLIDDRERLVSLSKADLRSFTILTDSTMPSYKDKLTSTEMADLLGYLASLKGTTAQ